MTMDDEQLHRDPASDPPSDPFGDVINLLAAPLATGIRSYEQFRRGVDDLFRTVENLNATMENLNETAERVNRLLADVEEPVRAMVPRLTRTITAADELLDTVGGPAIQIAETLSSPAFRVLPQRLDEFVGIMGDVSRRLGPLTSFAETAGGMFGLRRPTVVVEPEPPATKKPATKKPAAKKAAAKRAPRKKAAASKSAASKSAGRR
jgi:hypothetical protein